MANSTWNAMTVGASGVQVPDGTVAAPALAFASETATGRYRIGANNIGEAINGAPVMDWNATRLNMPTGVGLSFNGDAGTTGKVLIGGTTGAWTASPSLTGLTLSGTAALATVTQSGKTTTYNGVTTAGLGMPVIVAYGRVTAQSAANSSIVTYTVGASDGSFEVSGNLNASAITVLATTLTCTYTDESNTSRSMIFPIQQLAGSLIAAGAITATGPWHSPVQTIRAKAATVITILTSAGTFSGVTYTAEGLIKQTA